MNRSRCGIVCAAILGLALANPHIAPAQRPHTRQGFWFNIGLGYASLGCQACGSREGGPTGSLALGGTLSQKVVIGAGTTGWAKSSGDPDLVVGTLTALIRFYPSATGGFFILGGLGVGIIAADITDVEKGVGALVGFGYDVRVGNNVSITPFWNGFAVNTTNADANVGQLGIGVTLH